MFRLRIGLYWHWPWLTTIWPLLALILIGLGHHWPWVLLAWGFVGFGPQWTWPSLAMGFIGLGLHWSRASLVLAFIGLGLHRPWASLALAFIGFGYLWLFILVALPLLIVKLPTYLSINIVSFLFLGFSYLITSRVKAIYGIRSHPMLWSMS